MSTPQVSPARVPQSSAYTEGNSSRALTEFASALLSMGLSGLAEEVLFILIWER